MTGPAVHLSAAATGPCGVAIDIAAPRTGFEQLRRIKVLWLLLAVLSFACQNLALGHVHLHAPVHGPVLGQMRADASADNGDEGHECPLCQAQQWIGQPLLPGDVVFLPAPAAAVYLYPRMPAAPSGHGRSHIWHSRAPPLSA